MAQATIRIRGTLVTQGNRGSSAPSGNEPLFRLAPGSTAMGRAMKRKCHRKPWCVSNLKTALYCGAGPMT